MKFSQQIVATAFVASSAFLSVEGFVPPTTGGVNFDASRTTQRVPSYLSVLQVGISMFVASHDCYKQHVLIAYTHAMV